MKQPHWLAALALPSLAQGKSQLTVDLSDMSLKSAQTQAPFWPATPLLSSVLSDGTDVACLNCDDQLFGAWVRDLSLQRGLADQGLGCLPATKGLLRDQAGHGKHPNAPGYDAWAKGKKGSFLQRKERAPCNVTTTYLQQHDIETMKPRLQQLWQERRLVVGMGPNPMHQRLSFVGVLTKLARSSPAYTPQMCREEDRRSPACGVLLSELEPTAKIWEMDESLHATFGKEFLEAQRHNASLPVAEQWKRARTLLAALKHSFVFYRQGCLTLGSAESCELHGQSELVGQIACDPLEDTSADLCVYAELRRCANCSGNGGGFFEYARLHGPLALFGTRKRRSWVMGQCEEFSRAGFALFASLGYEARYVLDFTDHVWIEVKLPREGKAEPEWVHADPSEGVLDQPLMYEKGWGKKLTMIFSFTPWKVEHVTQRYTADYESTLWRRGIGEEELRLTLEETNHRLLYEKPIRSWGHAADTWRSGNRSLEDLALWANF